MASTFSVNTFEAELCFKHQANIEQSLAHRLAVARASNNVQLIQLLEQEKQQVESAQSSALRRSPVAWLNTLWQKIMEAISNNAELQVWRTTDAAGMFWWHAYDPHTGRSVATDSESELRFWIERNYEEI